MASLDHMERYLTTYPAAGIVGFGRTMAADRVVTLATISSYDLVRPGYSTIRRISMPKVLGLHEVELPPGVTPEEYEQVFGKELASLPNFQGWKTYLLKGDRGERAGEFFLLFEVESVEARDRYFPSPEEESEEARRFAEQHPEATAVWEKYAVSMSKPHGWTDYVVIGGPSS